MNVILAAFLLTLFAGLSTGIGSAIPFFFKKFRQGYLAFFLGLSAGVMILVSFAELMPAAVEEIDTLWTFIIFFIGMISVVLIDLLIPHGQNPHHMSREKNAVESIQIECQSDDGTCPEEEELEGKDEQIESRLLNQEDPIITSEEKKRALTRTGVITAIAIAIHNFPEGIATFAAAYGDISVGISIAIAIAIHNIPEGISVSIPIYYATKSKWKSFGLSLGSGLAEPVGAGIGYLIIIGLTKINFFANILTLDQIIAGSLAFVAGIMVYISIDELIPVAHEYGKGDLVMGGVFAGMVIMALSLILFQYI